jgi:hypothetical protein
LLISVSFFFFSLVKIFKRWLCLIIVITYIRST